MNRPCPDSVVPNHGVEPARVDGSRLEVAEFDAARRERVRNLPAGGPMRRHAERQQRAGADGPTDRNREHQVDGHLGARDDAEADDRGDEAPGDVAPAPTDVGTDDDRERRRGRDVDGTGELGADDPGVAVLGRDECGRTGQIEDLLQTPGEQRRHAPGHGRHQHGAGPAHDDERDGEHDRVQERDELRHPDEKALERIGQVPEEAQEVGLEALEGTLVGDRDEQPEEEHDRGRRERQQLDR